MVHLLFRKKNRAERDRDEEWEGEAVRWIQTRNIMRASYTPPHPPPNHHSPIIKRKKMKEGNYESKAVVHAYSYS